MFLQKLTATPDLHIDGDSRNNFLHWCNEGKEGTINAEFYYREGPNMVQVHARLIQDVNQGQEILMSYGYGKLKSIE